MSNLLETLRPRRFVPQQQHHIDLSGMSRMGSWWRQLEDPLDCCCRLKAGPSRQGKALSRVPTEGVVISPTIPGGRVSSIIGWLLDTTLIALPTLSNTPFPSFKASHNAITILASSESFVIYTFYQGCLK